MALPFVITTIMGLALGVSPGSLGNNVRHVSVFENSNECLGVFVDELNLFVWYEPDRD